MGVGGASGDAMDGEGSIGSSSRSSLKNRLFFGAGASGNSSIGDSESTPIGRSDDYRSLRRFGGWSASQLAFNEDKYLRWSRDNVAPSETPFLEISRFVRDVNTTRDAIVNASRLIRSGKISLPKIGADSLHFLKQ